jgi:hypothetical protein
VWQRGPMLKKLRQRMRQRLRTLQHLVHSASLPERREFAKQLNWLLCSHQGDGELPAAGRAARASRVLIENIQRFIALGLEFAQALPILLIEAEHH